MFLRLLGNVNKYRLRLNLPSAGCFRSVLQKSILTCVNYDLRVNSQKD
jgi:hypothetical protein